MEAQTPSPRAPLFSRQALIRLIVPLVIEQFLLMTVGMADTVMVTSAGEAAVSGISLVDQINNLIIQVFAALATGGAVVVSQYLGRREPDNAATASRQLLYAASFLSLLLTALALIFRQHVLALIFGQVEQSVMDSALVYFLLTALAYPFISVYNAGAALFRSMGNSKVSMFCSLIVNLINITVNAVMIFGFHLGAAGAGIGTLVSRVAAAVIIMVLLRHPNNVLRLDGLFPVRPRWDMIRRILFVGIPTGMENGMFQAGKLLVLNLITSFQVTAMVAANAIANSIGGFTNVPGMAIGMAMITVVGQCVGARETEQAVAYAKKLMALCYACMTVMASFLFFASNWLVTLFHLSPEAAAMAAQVLRLFAVFYVFWPLSFTLPNALRAAGDAVFTMAVSLTSMFVCRVALSYVFACSWGLGLGLFGVWLAMCVDWVVRGGFFLFRFWRGRWKSIKVI